MIHQAQLLLSLIKTEKNLVAYQSRGQSSFLYMDGRLPMNVDVKHSTEL